MPVQDPIVIRRWQYADAIGYFLTKSVETIVGEIAANYPFAIEPTQMHAWKVQIHHLQRELGPYREQGKVYFEYDVPRMGKRIDVVLLLGQVIFVIEYKVGESAYPAHAILQVWDYALDLKNFHETSHHLSIVPVLVSSEGESVPTILEMDGLRDGLYRPVCTNLTGLGAVIRSALDSCEGQTVDPEQWDSGRYAPTPTIVEAAMALYAGHNVANISRSDAGAQNLSQTSGAIEQLIASAKQDNQKVLCLLTGVPGAGKTLVGLNVATLHTDPSNELYSVYLSGNGPLVAILHEALARDRVTRDSEQGIRTTKGQARQAVKEFIQNVHHFRDDCLKDTLRPPIEHVAIFDEAQRAWNLEQTASFMSRKKGVVDFNMSEPEFLISCLDRHPDWAVVVCLVGGGQEINTGEAGIGEWVGAIERSFPHWHIHVSPRLHDSEYGAGQVVESLSRRPHVTFNDDLHLNVSMRSFRAEHVSTWVKAVLDSDREEVHRAWSAIRNKYRILLTRDLAAAKRWLKAHARGTERYGIVASSQAERLKPHAINVRSPMDPVHWFLDDYSDVRSSYYMEDVATEFHVQGLELDWACVVWDGDFRHHRDGWTHHSFVGSRWQNIHKPERQTYLKNAYRVLLTRARQGMVIVVPEGDEDDPTRASLIYDDTYEYLLSLGLPVIAGS
jgi:hypothetical protein